MGDFKSKLPDINEIKDITKKLYKDIKNSVAEIITDYKNKRPETQKTDDKKEEKDSEHKTKHPQKILNKSIF